MCVVSWTRSETSKHLGRPPEERVHLVLAAGRTVSPVAKRVAGGRLLLHSVGILTAAAADALRGSYRARRQCCRVVRRDVPHREEAHAQFPAVRKDRRVEQGGLRAAGALLVARRRS